MNASPTAPTCQLRYPYVPRNTHLGSTVASEVVEIANLLRSRSVLLDGLPGVGKSRLAHEVTDHLDVTPVARIRATKAASRVAFAPFVDLLPPTVDPDDHCAIFHTVVNQLPPLDTDPPLLVVDDIDVLDDESAALTLHLVATGRARLLATLRNVTNTPDAVVALWKDRLAERVTVRALPHDSSRELAEQILGKPISEWLHEWLWQRSGGTPMDLYEVLHAAELSGALEDLGEMITLKSAPNQGLQLVALADHRMRELTSEQREAIELIALAEPLRWSVAAELVGSQPLIQLEQQDEIVSEKNSDGLFLSTRQPLFGELLRRQLPLSSIAAQYKKLSEALLNSEPSESERLRAVTWQLDYGLPVDQSDLYEAAKSALRLGQPQAAIRLARAARANEPAAAILEANGHLEAGCPHAAAQVLEELDERQLSAKQRRSSARLKVAVAVRTNKDHCIDELLVRDLPGDEAFACAAQVTLLANQGRYHEARSVAGDIASTSMTFATTPIAWALMQTGDGRGARAITHDAYSIEGGGERARNLFEGWAAARVESMADWISVDTHAVATTRAAVEMGDRALAGSVLAYRGRIALLRGQLRTAKRYFLEARWHLQLADPGQLLGLIEAWLSITSSMLGVDDLETRLAAADHLARAPGWLRRSGHLARAEAWAAAARGDLEDARREAAVGASMVRGICLLDEAELLHDGFRFGGRDQCAATRLAELSATCDLRPVQIRAAHASSLLLGDAEELLRISRDLEIIGARLLAAEVAADAAAVRNPSVATGRSAMAVARSRALAGQCEGAVTPPLQQREDEQLTERQLEIVELAVRGLTSAKIADELTLSVRTVESHLFRAMKRLGVTSRSELAGALPVVCGELA